MAQISTNGALHEMFHIYNRGVDKRTVFQDTYDFVRFYESLYYFNTIDPVTNLAFAKIQDYKKKETLVAIKAYCLLPNHFHLILEQKQENGIGEFMKRVSGGYTSYFNEKNNRSGVLFQGAYKRSLVKNEQYKNYLFSYVNENYIVHGKTTPNNICYSSTWHYQKIMKSRLITTDSRTYNLNAHQAIALEIYKLRSSLKRELLEE